MSSERGGGGLGAAFVLLIFVGAVAKFWVWIAVAFGAAVLFGLLLWLAFYAARRVDERENARRRSPAGPINSTLGCSPTTSAAHSATTRQPFDHFCECLAANVVRH